MYMLERGREGEREGERERGRESMYISIYTDKKYLEREMLNG